MWALTAALTRLQERKNIACSLQDTNSIVQSLEFGLGVVMHFIAGAVYLLIWWVLYCHRDLAAARSTCPKCALHTPAT